MNKAIALIMLFAAVASTVFTASAKAEEQNSAAPIAEVCYILDYELE